MVQFLSEDFNSLTVHEQLIVSIIFLPLLSHMVSHNNRKRQRIFDEEAIKCFIGSNEIQYQ